MEVKKRKGEFRNCKICDKNFYALPAQVRTGVGFYCSHSCFSKSRNNTYRLGKYAQKGAPVPPTAYKKIGLTFKGTISEYKALHYWVNKQIGKALVCEKCGSIIKIQWANISWKYLKNIHDWMALCVRCHLVYDGKLNS